MAVLLDWPLQSRCKAQPKIGNGFTSSCTIMPVMPIIYTHMFWFNKERHEGRGRVKLETISRMIAGWDHCRRRIMQTAPYLEKATGRGMRHAGDAFSAWRLQEELTRLVHFRQHSLVEDNPRKV